MSLRILFIGGTGTISSASTELALQRGMNVTLLNRGRNARSTAPAGAEVVIADIHDSDAARAALAGRQFDAVVDWIAYEPEHVAADLELFRGRVGQFIFISSAAVYHHPPPALPVTESSPVHNPDWPYSFRKIQCEDLLMEAYRDEGFPVTIVRPSHTYAPWALPLTAGYTSVARMRRGDPVVIHGDGTSLWVVTHHADFAKGFVGLLGNSHAIGEAVHITSDQALTWNQIYQAVADAAGAELHAVHVPSSLIAAYDPPSAPTLLADKSHSMIFDNSRIKRLVPDFAATIPFSIGAREIMAWFDAVPARQRVNGRYDRLCDQLVAAIGSIQPASAGTLP